ncbi:hypothetical protein LG293_17570 (plasmid) [Citricoccus nitrophenolicus]
MTENTRPESNPSDSPAEAAESEFWHPDAMARATKALTGAKVGPVNAQHELDAVDAEFLARKALAEVESDVEEVIERSDRLARKVAEGPVAAQLSQKRLAAAGMTSFATHLRAVHTLAQLMTPERLATAEKALAEAGVPLDILRAHHIVQAAAEAEDLAATITAEPVPGTDD